MKDPMRAVPSAWREEGALEGAAMRAVFALLLAASGCILALDFQALWQRDAENGSEQVTRVVIQPPTETDQERPYYPKALPVLPGSDAPAMPGLSARPTPEIMAARMSFYLGPNGDVSAVGRIEPGTAADFDKFLGASAAGAKRVWFLSPGGSVDDAMNIGRSIRKRALDTAVPDNGYCASSCPLAYVGGVHRSAGRHSLIGVHQVFTLTSEPGNWHEGLSAAQQISAACEEHLVSMGVDPNSWIKAMKTPKERLYVFTPTELEKFKIATAVGVASG